jgi:hypothetical protein
MTLNTSESSADARDSLDVLRQRAKAAISTLRRDHTAQDRADATALLEELRNQRQFEPLMAVAEAMGRIDARNAKARRLYAQGLIETGKVTAAIDVLQSLAKQLPKRDPEALEVAGLLGRSYKQIFFDSHDRGSPSAKQALIDAVEAYRKPYEDDARNTWHGVNLLALVANCKRLGIDVDAGIELRGLAAKLRTTLLDPGYSRDEWYLPTLAEVTLGTGDWSEIERILRTYVTAPDVQAFQLRSTLRQFTSIWNLDDDEYGHDLVNILRARLLELPGGSLDISAEDVRRLRSDSPPDQAQLEALLGKNGPQTFQWWRTGLERASSVAAIRSKLGQRVGTGFLVRASELGLGSSGELLVITNFHVVNPKGATPGIRPEKAEVVFEAVDAERRYGVAELLITSPPNECDVSVLRLDAEVSGVEPLPLAIDLPELGDSARVYLIGHPGGRDLSFSFQDNELLDHEGPPNGKPQIPGVCRVHYSAPTEGGSSGSPVFESHSWEVVALHHKGGKLGMPKLNGVDGTYAANEGVWVRSIIELARKQAVENSSSAETTHEE